MQKRMTSQKRVAKQMCKPFARCTCKKAPPDTHTHATCMEEPPPQTERATKMLTCPNDCMQMFTMHENHTFRSSHACSTLFSISKHARHLRRSMQANDKDASYEHHWLQSSPSLHIKLCCKSIPVWMMHPRTGQEPDVMNEWWWILVEHLRDSQAEHLLDTRTQHYAVGHITLPVKSPSTHTFTLSDISGTCSIRERTYFPLFIHSHDSSEVCTLSEIHVALT